MFVWKWIMSLKKEITEDLRKRVDVAHQARKGYKTTSKVFGLHKSTVRQIVYKRRKFKTTVTFPRRLSANKDHSEAECVIVCEVVKVPWVTSKQLKAFLTLAYVNVHEPIRRTLHGRVARRKPLFSKRKLLAKDHVNKPEDSLRILSHWWNMVAVVSWLGPVLLNLGQEGLPSLMEQ